MNSIRQLLDKALDLTVAPGYTSAGYRLRGLSWEDAIAGDFIRDKTALVTGASSGIGEATCEGLAAAGARVHMLVRDRERGERARERITARLRKRGVAPQLGLELCDLAELSSVRDFASRFTEREPELALLVNNAGVLPAERTLTDEGIELTFATNVLGPFLLTNLLFGSLRRGAPSRVVTVTSGGMYTARLDVDDLQLERRDYDGPRFYAHAKRAQVTLTELWAERERGHGVRFFAVHPGWADTPGLARSLPRFRRALKPVLRDARQGADTIVWLGTAAEPPGGSGELWHDRGVRPKHRLPRTSETTAERERLWSQLCRLTERHEPDAGAGDE
ncbi:MAG: SDR family NAD(P)-dependent oxidoreductase [Solirubrobacterales bacterium]